MRTSSRWTRISPIIPTASRSSLEKIKDADVVLGSRYRDGHVNVVNWPMSRLFLSYAANIYARAVTGLPIYDTTGGFKCFRRKVLEVIDLNAIHQMVTPSKSR